MIAGLLVWVFLSLLAGVSGWAVATAWAPDRRWVERALAAGLLSLAAIHTALTGPGLLGLLRPWPAGLCAFFLCGIPLGIVVRRQGNLLRSAFAKDLLAPARLFRDVLRRSELLLPWAGAAAVFALCTSALIAWHLPLWSWDCVWYHQAMTRYALQEGHAGWVPTNIWYINGYPKATELLAAWNCLFTHSAKLEALTQFPHAILGMLAVAAFAQRLSAPPSLAASSAALWLLAPAVYLQVHTTHADIPAGMFFMAGVYFLTSPRFDAFAQVMTAVALGMYAATKVTGLFHLALLSPLIVVRLAMGLGRSVPNRSRQLGVGLLAAAVLVWLGSHTFVRNVARTQNPFWPAKVTLPWVGALPGETDPETIAPMPAFFAAPWAFRMLVGHWFAVDPSRLKHSPVEFVRQLFSGGEKGIRDPFPDVRWDPYGKLFTHLLLWSFLLFAVLAPFRTERWAMLSVVLMAALAILVPAAWWGRFTLGFWGAACAGFASLHQMLPARVLRVLLSAVAAYLAVDNYAFRFEGYQVTPTVFGSARDAAKDEARLRAVANWMFSPQQAALRERDLRSGEVVSYDGHMGFLGELWTEDLRNRVEQVLYTGDDSAFLSALRSKKVRWAGVERGTGAQRLLASHPEVFTPLFISPLTQTELFRVDRKFWEAPPSP